MADPVIRYCRTDQYVEHTGPQTETVTDRNGKETEVTRTVVAHGLIGTLWIGGLCFDTIERMDGYVCQEGDKQYPNSSIYWMDKYDSYVINPWLGIEAEKKGTKTRNILYHPAARPQHLAGCIGVGFLNGTALTESQGALAAIWEGCGGVVGDFKRNITINIIIEGKMKPLGQCRRYNG